MNRSPIFRTFLICLVLVTALSAAQSLFAQTGNLLTNPGFEKPFQAVAGSTTSMVAQGWTAWSVQSGQDTAPEYYPASDTTNGMPTPRIRSGSDAQQYFTYFAPHTGGVYQTVSGVKAGDQLTFSIYAYLWVSSGSDASSSDGSGQVAFQVGIDPKGGTDATSSSIVWSSAPTTYDKYTEYSVTAAAAGSSVTAFARSTVNKVAMNNVVYLDDASLTVTGTGTAPAASTSEATAAAASTSAPAVSTVAGVAATQVVAPPAATQAATAEVTQAPTVIPFVSTEAATEAPTAESTILVPPVTFVPPPATAEVTQAATAVSVTETVAQTATVVAPTEAPATAEVTQVALVPTIATTEASTPEVTAAATVTQEVTIPIVPTTAPSATVAPTNTLTNTATSTPTATLAATTAPTNTPTDTATQGPSPTSSNTPTASSTPSPTNTATPSNTPTPSPTLNQTQFPYLLQYTVVRGDTVSGLATRFGSTVSAIIVANQLGADARIYETQKLVIPVETLPQAQAPTPLPPPTQAAQIAPTLVPPTLIPSSTPMIAPTSTETPIVVQPAASATAQGQAQAVVIMTTYVVHYGDTLSTIASRFGLTTQQLADANDIVNPNLIRLGQVLKVPQSGTATPMPTSTPVASVTSTNIPLLPTSTPIPVMPAVSTPIPVQSAQPMTYQVMPGDNLYRISVKFSVPIVALIEANSIYDANRIFVGEILVIP